MQEDLTKLDLITLRNLYFKEAREFIAALDVETAEQLQVRRDRIRQIDAELERRKVILSIKVNF